MTCKEKQSNNGVCPHHNLQCGWPKCNEPEQPAQQEPVAWRTFDGEGGYDYRSYDENENYAEEWAKRNPRHQGWVEPLYTAPQPAQQPLTDAQIGAVAADIWGSVLIAPQSYQAFARAIEAAHGIKEQNMTQQPTALRLADELQGFNHQATHKAAAELRRLHNLCAEWEKKAATWLASPEAAKRLDGYRELAQRVNMLEAALRQAVDVMKVCYDSNYGLGWLWQETAHRTAMTNTREAITAAKQALEEKP